MNTVETFGEWLKERRRQLDLTQQELADRAGCSVGTIRKIEQNARRPSKQLAGLIGRAVSVPADQEDEFIAFARTEAYTAPVPVSLMAMDGPAVQPPDAVFLTTTSSPFKPETSPIEPAPAVAVRQNLPSNLPPFIGRKTELAALEEMLIDPEKRLITIVGPGGMGKTRLALALGEQFAHPSKAATMPVDHPFPDGIYFVALAPLTQPDQIPTAIAEAFDLPLEGGGRQRRTVRRQILDFLEHKQLLLVLDNFEHLLGGADLVTAILDRAPDVQILITSRERLNLRTEQLYPIEGLRFPKWETPLDAAEYTAVQLFVQSAKRVVPEFELTADDLLYLSRICRLVEGMPLAVELAASWVDLLSLPDIAVELQNSIDFLETDVRDMPIRHRSMRLVFDASWERLEDSEQAIFAKLSIFRGGFTRQAAQAITGASLRQLGTLVNKSLLQFDQERDRYQIHELLRQYAAEKLAAGGDERLVRRGHCGFYLEGLDHLSVQLKGERQKEALADIEADFDNVRMAWHCALGGLEVNRLAKGMESLAYFLEWTGRYQEGEKLFRLATTALTNIFSADGLRTRARLLGWQSFFTNFVQEDERPVSLCEEGLALLEHKRLASKDTRREQADVYFQMGRAGHDYDRKKAALLKSLALNRELNDTWGTAGTLQLLGEPDSWYGSLVEIGTYLEECLSLRRGLRDARGIAHALILMSTLARYRGQFARAEPFAREALDISREIGSRATTVRGLFNFGMCMIHLARFAEAASAFKACEQLSYEFGDLSSIESAQFGQGEALLSMGHLDLARAYLSKWQIDTIEAQNWTRGYVYLIDQRYEEAEALFQEDLTRGLAIKNDMFTGINFTNLALVNLFQNRLEKARSFTIQGVEVALEMGHFVVMQHVLIAVVNILALEGEVERALALDALSRRDHPWADKAWYWDELKRPFLERAAALPAEVAAAARAGGRGLDFWKTAEVLRTELHARGWMDL